MTFSPKGLLVVGTQYQCGKTTFTAGLTGALRQNKFNVSAYHPVTFQNAVSIHKGLESQFISTVTGQVSPKESIHVETAEEISLTHWHSIQNTLRDSPYPIIIDTPGLLSTPWRIQGRLIEDALSLMPDWPVVLLSTGQSDFLDFSRLALAYLQSRNTQVVGFISTQTSAKTPETSLHNLTQSAMLLSQVHKIPYLGHVGYSPSICVLSMSQGNTIRMVEDAIDLLPIQLAMGLRV
jgi:dethiobiotin synthetase